MTSPGADEEANGHRTSTPETADGQVPDEQWQRLNRHTVWASTIAVGGLSVGVAVVVAVGLLLSEVGPGWSALWPGLGLVAMMASTALVETIRVRVTRYRLDEHRIERRVQFLSTSRTSLSRERIRNVELSSDIVQRWFGLREVKLATGDQEGERFKLQALDRAAAEALRVDLLGERATAQTGTLATLTPGWVRYAPVTLLTPALGLMAFVVCFQVADWFSAVPAMLAWFGSLVSGIAIWLVVVLMTFLALALGTIATVASFVEGWWKYRLERHEDGSLDLRRGLLVNRSTSFDGERIRGVTLHEPLGLRRLGAARLDVIAVGVSESRESGGQDRQSPALVPASPRSVSAEVGTAILGAEIPADLRGNPRAARFRRLVRAGFTTLAAVALALVPAVIWPAWWWLPVAIGVVTGAAMGYLALDDARGLGDHIDDARVTLRKGALFRRSEVLHRDGILGWNLKQGPLQRRLGLGSVVATSAGGTGACQLPDVGAEQAGELMATAGSVWEHLRVDQPPR